MSMIPIIILYCKLILKLFFLNFRNKKITLSLLESLEESKLFQGSSLILTKRPTSKDQWGVVFNYKAYYDSGLVKSIGYYNSSHNFVDCLRNINSNSEK